MRGRMRTYAWLRDGLRVVVHPHGCPKCGSTNLVRVARHWEEVEQSLDHIENFYGGSIALRAVVAPDASREVSSGGVTDYRIRCSDCGLMGDVLDFVTAVQS